MHSQVRQIVETISYSVLITQLLTQKLGIWHQRWEHTKHSRRECIQTMAHSHLEGPIPWSSHYRTE